MLDFNMCRWNLYKRPTKNLQLSHRCIGLSTLDILEFYHAEHNIVQNVQIFIISIQVDGPTYVLMLGPYTTHPTPILLLCYPYKPTTTIVVPLH